MEEGSHSPATAASSPNSPVPHRPTHAKCLVSFHHAASGAYGTTTTPRGHLAESVVSRSQMIRKADPTVSKLG